MGATDRRAFFHGMGGLAAASVLGDIREVDVALRLGKPPAADLPLPKKLSGLSNESGAARPRKSCSPLPTRRGSQSRSC